mgnify:CR=1 FL=1
MNFFEDEETLDGYDTETTGSRTDFGSEDKFSDHFDPLDLDDPVMSYLAQDEIEGKRKRKLKCVSCGHKFDGETGDYCPRCRSVGVRNI